MLYISQDHGLCYTGVGKSDTLLKKKDHEGVIFKRGSMLHRWKQDQDQICERQIIICKRNNYTGGISLPTTEKIV